MDSTACRSREGEEEADGKTKEAQRVARERDEVEGVDPEEENTGK